MQRCMGCMREFGEEFDVCPHCGYAVGSDAESKNHLAPGTSLQDGHYTLGKALGQGGFGITYIAWDNRIGRAVAIKEYMPNAFASRITGEKEVSCFNEEAQRQFDLGLAKTRKEANAMSQFGSLESVVKVHDCIEENKTAYIVMELLRGKTVKEILKEKNKLSFAETMRIMTPVLQTLDAMHGVGMIHRDVAPDNIFVCDDGKIKLLDFGAARVISGTDNKTLSVVLKAGYAPMEQYSSKSKQGPYSDVYAASATMYKMLTGETPPDSIAREKDADDLAAMAKTDAPQNAQKTILRGMAMKSSERIQSVQALLDALQKDLPEKIEGIDLREFIARTKEKKKKKTILIISGLLIVLIGLSSSIYAQRNKQLKPSSDSIETQTIETQNTKESITDTFEVSVSESTTENISSYETTEHKVIDAEDYLRQLLTSKTTLDIVKFHCYDYNADGSLEAFAVVANNVSHKKGVTFNAETAEIWFVSSKECVLIHPIDDGGVYVSVPEVYALNGSSVSNDGEDSLLGWSIGTTGNHTRYENYTVDRFGNYKLIAITFDKIPELSSHFEYESSHYDEIHLNFVSSVMDLTLPHYYYFDSDQCCFVEFGGIEITQQQLTRLKDADAILTQIKNEGGIIDNILYRDNGVININYKIDPDNPFDCYAIILRINHYDNSVYEENNLQNQTGIFYQSEINHLKDEEDDDYFSVSMIQVTYPNDYPY